MEGVGFELLKMERDIFGDSSSHLAEERLYEIVEKAGERINHLKEPADILGGIRDVLKELGYTYRGGDFKFTESLEGKGLSCRDYTYVHLEIAKRNDLPLYAVTAPFHIFIRWDGGRERVDWEPTGGFETSDIYYKNSFHISESSAEKGVYLKCLSDEEVMANQQVEWGRIFTESSQPERALGFFDKAMRVDPDNPWAWVSKALAHGYLGDHDKAMECYNKSVELGSSDKSVI